MVIRMSTQAWDESEKTDTSRKRHWFNTSIRWLIYLVFITLTIYQSSEVITSYLSYRVTVGIDIRDGVKFPAVTVCNQIPINNDKELPNSYKRIELLDYFYKYLKQKTSSVLDLSDREVNRFAIKFACGEYPYGSLLFDDFCVDKTDLVWDGKRFLDYNANEYDVDTVCLTEGHSTLLRRYCNCEMDFWGCLDENNTCINYDQVCDGTVNCRNGEDEVNCLGYFIVNTVYRYHVSSTWSLHTSQYHLGSSNNFVGSDYPPGILIKQCRFQGVKCDEIPDFTWKPVYTSKHGLCFTFSPSSLNYNNWRVEKEFGLNFMLNPQVFSELLDPKRGHTIVLHHPDEIPVPEQNGIDIGARLSVSLSVKPKVYNKLGGKYGECHPATWEYQGTYTMIACTKMCIETQIRETNNCYEYLSDLENISIVTSQYPPCSQVFGFQYEINDINIYSKVDRKKCNCPQSCDQTLYLYSQQTAEDSRVMYDTLKILKKMDAFTYGGSKDQKWNSYISIYLDSVNYEYVYETPEMNLHSLVSQVGGIVGIYVGVCVLSVVNFFTNIGNIAGRIKSLADTKII